MGIRVFRHQLEQLKTKRPSEVTAVLAWLQHP